MIVWRRPVGGRSVVGAIVALCWIVPAPALGFQACEVEEPHRVVAAILSFPLPSAPASGTDLCVLDLDLPGTERDLNLVYGVFGDHREPLRWFAAAGLQFPDPRSLGSSTEEEDAPGIPLTLGPWAGLGATWPSDSPLRIAAEGRFTPATVTVGDPGDAPRFQAGLSVAMTW